MSAWFTRHTGVATIVLLAVAILVVLGVDAVATGSAGTGILLLLVAALLWQPIAATVSTTGPRVRRRDDDY